MATDRIRAISTDEMYSRQAAAQEAAKDGRDFSAADLPAEAASAAHDRSNKTSERFQVTLQDHQRPGRGNQNSGPGGGRSR